MRLTLTVLRCKPHFLKKFSKKFNSTCLLHVNHHKLLRRNIYFCIYVFGLQKRNVSVDAICASVKNDASHRRKFVSKQIGRWPDGHRPVPRYVSRWASADLLRDFLKSLVYVRHSTMLGQAPYGARVVAIGIVRLKF